MSARSPEATPLELRRWTVNVQVHEVTHRWAMHDPAQPLFAKLPAPAMSRVRDGFVEAVRDLSRETGGPETTALLAVGRRAST